MSEKAKKNTITSLIVATVLTLIITGAYQCTSTKAQAIWEAPKKVNELEVIVEKQADRINDLEKAIVETKDAADNAYLASKSNNETIQDLKEGQKTIIEILLQR